VRVPAHALAELDARYGPFSALIMDIEGAELEILQASIEILNRYRLVVVELHEWAIGASGNLHSRRPAFPASRRHY
jgi:hypothetical protein